MGGYTNYIFKVESLFLQSYGLPEDDLIKDGDIMLGFLFPLSTAGPGQTCGLRVRGFAVQGAQSALYVIDQINADPNILPDVSLGYALLNDCGSGKVGWR